MPIIARILFAAGISTFGNWLTFLGIALFVQQNYGSAHVPFIFIVQSLPSLAFSRGFARLISPARRDVIYIGLQVVAAVLLLPLIVAPSLFTIYLFLVGSSIARAVASPLFTSLVGEWIEADNLRSAHVRLAAIGAGTLAIAPIIGGFIAQTIGYELLFALDALSYIAAAAILIPLPPRLRRTISQALPPHQSSRFWLPPEVQGPVLVPLAFWVAWMFVGAYMTSIEFLLFEFNALSKLEVGLVLGAWGIGNLAAMPVAHRALIRKLGGWRWCLFYTVGLAFFSSGNGVPSAAAGFLIAGFCCAVLTGSLRAAIQTSLHSSADSLPVWAWCNQLTAIINITVYAILGIAIMNVSTAALAAVMIAISSGFAALMYVGRNKFDDIGEPDVHPRVLHGAPFNDSRRRM